MFKKVNHFINVKKNSYMQINFNIFHFLLFKCSLSTEVFKIVFLLNALFGGGNILSSTLIYGCQKAYTGRREEITVGFFFCLAFKDLRLLEVAKFPWVMAGWQRAHIASQSCDFIQTFPWSTLSCHWLGCGWVQHGQFTWELQSGW